MDRREYIALGGATVSAAVSGCLGITRRDKPWATLPLFPSDIVRDFHSEQYLEISPSHKTIEGRNLPAENREHHIEIDFKSLEQYGVDLENLSIQKTQERERVLDWHPEVTGPTGSLTKEPNTDIETVEITDGTVDVVFATPENISLADPVGLTLMGFEFTDVEAPITTSYDVRSSDDHVSASQREFKIFDPQQLPPTLYPSTVIEESENQLLTIDWLVAENEEMVIEINTSVMNEHGVIHGPVVEENVRGGILESATTDGSKISMRLLPDSDSDFATVQIRLDGMEIRTTAEGLIYGMTVEGDTHETVETNPFDILPEPTPE